MGLTASERALMEVLMAAKKPMDLRNVFHVVLPRRPMPWSLATYRQRWTARVNELTQTWIALERRRLIDLATNDGLYEITAAGRDALDGARKDTGTCT